MSTKRTRLLQEYIDRFGLTMDLGQIAEVFHITKASVYNLISAERIPFDTFQMKNIGGKKGRRLAHTRDVVRFIEAQQVLG